MLCEIPASSYKPAHLVSVSLASDVFMGFSKSANRRREEFVGFHCTCSHTLLWLISTMLLSCYTLLIQYYCVCTNFKGCIGKHICPQACDPYPKVPPGGALALFICAPSVWQEGRVRQNNKKKKVQQGSCCPSAPASNPQVRVKKMIWKKSRFLTNKYLLYQILKIFAHRCKFLHFSLLGLIQVRGFGHNVNSCGHLVIALSQGPGFFSGNSVYFIDFL